MSILLKLGINATTIIIADAKDTFCHCCHPNKCRSKICVSVNFMDFNTPCILLWIFLSNRSNHLWIVLLEENKNWLIFVALNFLQYSTLQFVVRRLRLILNIVLCWLTMDNLIVIFESNKRFSRETKHFSYDLIKRSWISSWTQNHSLSFKGMNTLQLMSRFINGKCVFGEKFFCFIHKDHVWNKWGIVPIYITCDFSLDWSHVMKSSYSLYLLLQF